MGLLPASGPLSGNSVPAGAETPPGAVSNLDREVFAIALIKAALVVLADAGMGRGAAAVACEFCLPATR